MKQRKEADGKKSSVLRAMIAVALLSALLGGLGFAADFVPLGIAAFVLCGVFILATLCFLLFAPGGR